MNPTGEQAEQHGFRIRSFNSSRRLNLRDVYETNDGIGRTRYHLFAAKNKSTDDADVVSGMMLWTGRPKGTETTLSSSYSLSATASQAMTVANAADWPTRGFWIRNKTVNNGAGDLRYVDYRSGNVLYTKPVLWGKINFTEGTTEILPGTAITDSYSTSNSAVVDQVVLTGGSWATGTAQGTLYLKKYVGNMYSGYEIRVGGVKVAKSSSTAVRGHRDCTGSTWSSANVIEPVSDLDIGIEIPDENGLFRDPASENLAPNGIAFGVYDDQKRSLFASALFPGKSVGIWLRQTILDGTQARENIEGDLSFEWY